MKKHLFLVPILGLLLVGCGSAPETITVTAPATSVEVGKTLQLSVSVEPEGASDSVEFYVAESSKAYLSVSKSGLVQGIAKGTGRVYAKSKKADVEGYINLDVVEAGTGGGGGEKTLSIDFSTTDIFSTGTGSTWYDETKTHGGLTFGITKGRQQTANDYGPSYLMLDGYNSGNFYSDAAVGTYIKSVEITFNSGGVSTSATVDCGFGSSKLPAAGGSPVTQAADLVHKFEASGTSSNYFALYAGAKNVQIKVLKIVYVS